MGGILLEMDDWPGRVGQCVLLLFVLLLLCHLLHWSGLGWATYCCFGALHCAIRIAGLGWVGQCVAFLLLLVGQLCLIAWHCVLVAYFFDDMTSLFSFLLAFR